MKINNSLKNLFLFNGIFCFAANLLGPLYAIYVNNNIGNNILLVTVSWSVGLFSTTFFVYFISKMGDGFNKKNMMLASFLIRGAVWFSMIFINQFYQLLVVMVFIGLAESLGTPAFNALFAEHLDDGKHVAEYSDWTLIFNLSLGLGTFFGGLIVAYYGFALLFALMTLLAIISFIGIYFKGNIFDEVYTK